MLRPMVEPPSRPHDTPLCVRVFTLLLWPATVMLTYQLCESSAFEKSRIQQTEARETQCFLSNNGHLTSMLSLATCQYSKPGLAGTHLDHGRSCLHL